MLAAQVNARKHDNLRMILGFEWSGGLCLCEALLGWVGWSRLQPLAVVAGDFGPNIHLPPLRASGSCGSPLHCVRIGRSLDARRFAFVLCASGGPLSHDVRVFRGRFGDLSLRLRSM